jgi:hypothetical protein
MTTETALDDDNNVNLQASVKDEPNPNSPPSGADTAGEITKQAGTPVTAQPVSVAPPVPTNVEPSMMSSSANNAGSLDSSSNSSTTTSAPASARAPATAPPQLTPEQAARQQQNRNQQRINKKLEGLANLNPTDMTSTDMDQLSALIDKTTDLLKMLPEGFLAKASI